MTMQQSVSTTVRVKLHALTNRKADLLASYSRASRSAFLLVSEWSLTRTVVETFRCIVIHPLVRRCTP